MPELPEVETIINDLKKVLPGLSVRGAWTDWEKTIKWPKKFKDFKKEIIGEKITRVNRRGKNILIELSGNKTLLVHQKLTGHLLYGPFELVKGKWLSTKTGPLRDDPQNRFLHLVLSLSDGNSLALSDVRKFAKVILMDSDKIFKLPDIEKLGIEPLDKEFSFKKFNEIITKKRGFVRDVLMNQEVIAGIGNIYCSEILWNAGIDPFKETGKLSAGELKKLYASIKKILKQAVKLRGDSIIDYRDAFGKKGKYQSIHKAYGMEGEKCAKKDGGVIKRIKRKGRSAFFCPAHQK